MSILILRHILAVITTLDDRQMCSDVGLRLQRQTAWPWKWMHYSPPELRSLIASRQGVTSRKTCFTSGTTSRLIVWENEKATWRQLLIPKHPFYCWRLPSSVRLYVWLMQCVSAGSLASFLRDLVAGSSCCEGFHRIGCKWTDDGETNCLPAWLTD